MISFISFLMCFHQKYIRALRDRYQVSVSDIGIGIDGIGIWYRCQVSVLGLRYRYLVSVSGIGIRYQVLSGIGISHQLSVSASGLAHIVLALYSLISN